MSRARLLNSMRNSVRRIVFCSRSLFLFFIFFSFFRCLARENVFLTPSLSSSLHYLSNPRSSCRWCKSRNYTPRFIRIICFYRVDLCTNWFDCAVRDFELHRHIRFRIANVYLILLALCCSRSSYCCCCCCWFACNAVCCFWLPFVFSFPRNSFIDEKRCGAWAIYQRTYCNEFHFGNRGESVVKNDMIEPNQLQALQYSEYVWLVLWSHLHNTVALSTSIRVWTAQNYNKGTEKKYILHNFASSSVTNSCLYSNCVAVWNCVPCIVLLYAMH